MNYRAIEFYMYRPKYNLIVLNRFANCNKIVVLLLHLTPCTHFCNSICNTRYYIMWYVRFPVKSKAIFNICKQIRLIHFRNKINYRKSLYHKAAIQKIIRSVSVTMSMNIVRCVCVYVLLLKTNTILFLIRLMPRLLINHTCKQCIASKWQKYRRADTLLRCVQLAKCDLCKGVPGEMCSSYDYIKEVPGWTNSNSINLHAQWLSE